MAQSNPVSVIRFLHTIEQLKRTKRTGWLDYGVKGPESIGDHMHRMGVMAMLINDPSLDRDKCIKMAIVHDLAEAIVGDITPHAGVSKQDKFNMEKSAMDGFQTLLGDTDMAQEITGLWNEYEEAITPEALLVKDLDKFEMIVQALEYEKSDGKNLQSFFDSTQGKFMHPVVKAWAEALYAERAGSI
ncbi:HD domain-containing protein [Phycomyces blakesleeanus]|uniref:5'-deoxynucleotidase n=1 Tax=Phycomyces blakesleeanus TaxID=4837 RepID=A0ABR3AKW1_PHYBL